MSELYHPVLRGSLLYVNCVIVAVRMSAILINRDYDHYHIQTDATKHITLPQEGAEY